MPNLWLKKNKKTWCTQCLRLTRFACWERTGCQFPLSSVVLLFFSAIALEKRSRGVRNPLVNDSWDLGHVLHLDTNVGSFHNPSIICFMRLPNIGTGLASPYLPLYPSRTSHAGAGCQRALGPLHFLLLTAEIIWQYEAVWRERKKNGWSERREW